MGTNADTFTVFEDMNLQVGDRLQLVSVLQEKKVISFTNLIGFEKNNFIFVKFPQANGVDVPLNIGERLDVVIFSGDSIFNFLCTVDEIYLGFHQFAALSFPQKIYSTRLRNDPRAKVNLPISVNSKSSGSSEQVIAMACDLSISGALLESDSQLGEVGQSINLTLKIQTKATKQEVAITSKAIIRNLQEIPENDQNQARRFRHGVQFNNLSDSEVVMMQNYIYESLLKKTSSTHHN